MKRLGKILGWVFAALAVVLAAGITFTIGWRPFIGARGRWLTARQFETPPACRARGEYLVRDVNDCMDCHAGHDWTAHDAPVLPNSLGAGQDMNILKGFPGKVYAPNITPENGRGQLERRPTGAGHSRGRRPRRPGTVSVHAVPGFPGPVRRRPGVDGRVPPGA